MNLPKIKVDLEMPEVKPIRTCLFCEKRKGIYGVSDPIVYICTVCYQKLKQINVFKPEEIYVKRIRDY